MTVLMLGITKSSLSAPYSETDYVTSPRGRGRTETTSRGTKQKWRVLFDRR